ILRLVRFHKPEMRGWPKKDANLILYIEFVLMGLFLTMNAADQALQNLGVDPYVQAGSFPVSQLLLPLFEGLSTQGLILVERTAWWLHILGVVAFLNYLYYSKDLHIILAFPNTYFGRIRPQGAFDNLESVTQEVRLMMDPNVDPFAAPTGEGVGEPAKFGASEVMDLNWVQLLGAYTCTECGRCTDE